MTRTLRALVVILGGGLALVACRKEAEPQAVPVPTGGPATTVASDGTAAPGDTAAAGGTAVAKPTPPPQTNPQPVRTGESIDACCSALSAVRSSGRGADAKAKSAIAARVCQGAAAGVKSGATSRASALTAVRSQLSGVEIPAECR